MQNVPFFPTLTSWDWPTILLKLSGKPSFYLKPLPMSNSSFYLEAGLDLKLETTLGHNN
jgi:hypothetical protein